MTDVEPTYGEEIAPGVHAIGPRTHGANKGGYARSYLFEQGDDLTIVDTGWDDDANMILKYLASVRRSPTQIKHIALTHAHRSHLGGVATLAGLSGAPVYCHETEAPIVEREQKAHPISLWPPVPLVLVPFRLASWLPVFEHQPPAKKCTWIKGGDTVGPLQVIHTPGHTPGHLAFLYDGSVLIAGDAIATWPKLGPGWPGFNMDEKKYRESLDRLVRLKPNVVGPGHGPPIVGDAAKCIRPLTRPRWISKAAATA